MNPKDAIRSSTYPLKGGGYLHIDRIILPICVPRHLRAVPPLPEKAKVKVTKTKVEKIPIAGARHT